MDSIVVSVSELYDLVKDMKADGMNYVSLSICDPSKDINGNDEPASLSFLAISNSDDYESVDYESIDAAPVTIDF